MIKNIGVKDIRPPLTFDEKSKNSKSHRRIKGGLEEKSRRGWLEEEETNVSDGKAIRLIAGLNNS